MIYRDHSSWHWSCSVKLLRAFQLHYLGPWWSIQSFSLFLKNKNNNNYNFHLLISSYNITGSVSNGLVGLLQSMRRLFCSHLTDLGSWLREIKKKKDVWKCCFRYTTDSPWSKPDYRELCHSLTDFFLSTMLRHQAISHTERPHKKQPCNSFAAFL